MQLFNDLVSLFSAIMEKERRKSEDYWYGSFEGCLGIFIIVIIIKADCNAVHLV